MLELLRGPSPGALAKRIVQEVREVPLANSNLQRLTPRCRQLIGEKVLTVNRMQAELHADYPQCQ